jgi:protein-disulfide isomerase
MQTKKLWYKNTKIVITLIFILFIVFLSLLLLIVNSLNSAENIKLKQTNYYKNDEHKKLIEGNGENSIGAENPKITIVEFGDFNCPYCKNSYSKIREITLKYKDEVKFIYRDLPILENSLELSLAARCAGEQGFFWNVHDKFFQNQKTDIKDIAVSIRLDIVKFNSCLKSKKYLNAIKKDISDANKLKISQTPIWFINGYEVHGDIPYDVFNKIIESLLLQ